MNFKLLQLPILLSQKVAHSFRRFPEAIVLALSTTAVLISRNHLNFANQDLAELLVRIAMVLALGIPLTLCFRLLLEKYKITKTVKVTAYLVQAGLLVLYYFLLLPELKINTVTRYLALNLALYCAFTFIFFLDQKVGFEQHVVKLLRQFFITVLYSVVLFIGLVAIVFTIDRLLFSIPSEIYFDVWLLVVGIFAPTYFLADVPFDKEDLSAFDYSKVLKVLLFFIVMPLITAYTVVLYLYFAKILITRQWPTGMVSHLVLWYSLVTIFVSFVIYPLRQDNRWVKTFLSLLPKLIIPLLIMMFTALGIRIRAYGLTENRYFVLLAGIWALGAIIYTSFVRNRKNVFLAITLACVMVLAVFGPWSAYSLAKYSQNARFLTILERNQMLEDGKIVKAPANISEEDKQDISSIILYFNRYHGLEDLNYLPADFQVDSMENVFGFPLDYYTSDREKYFYLHAQNKREALDIRGYDYFYVLGLEKNEVDQESLLEVDYQWENMKLTIKRQGQEIYSKDLAEIGQILYSQNKGKDSLSQKDLSFIDDNENVQILYGFRHLSGYEDANSGKIVLDPPEFYIFIKLNKD